ncbi:hypothetical protein GCM10027047_06010 [Rhodococcus aerolatus]
MLGLVAPCRCRLGPELADRWQAHLCGLCLRLRDHHGQLARGLTNTDAVLVSVLVEAQAPGPAARVTAGRCALRGMRTAEVVPADALAARLGATASLTLAAAKAGDVAGEAEQGLAPHAALGGRAARVVAPRLRGHAHRDGAVAAALGVDTVLDDLAGQAALEAAVAPGDDLDTVTGPSARACAAVFTTAATLAGVPANTAPLARLGADFGRLAHLLDALTDLADDARTGAFNPVTATATPLPLVRARCRALAARVRHGIDELELADDRLVRVLLVDTLRAAVHRVTCTDPVSAPPDRGPWWRRAAPWAAVYCTGYACCASHDNPCTGKRHEPACLRCDGCDCGCDC